MSESKLVYLRPECKGEHILWLHDILKSKSLLNAKVLELLEEGPVNMVTGNVGWRTPDESWPDMEVAEDGKTFFVNVVFKRERKLLTKRRLAAPRAGLSL
jgi:hypothetical protein